MGPEGRPVARALKSSLIPPQADEIEMTLFGPGYGECVLIHLGNHKWAIVDSCFNRDHRPAVLAYLRNLGLNPSEAVSLIVATHWHDDHIRGMGEVVEVCDKAAFCCASALGAEEFLAALAALERRTCDASRFRTERTLQGLLTACQEVLNLYVRYFQSSYL